MLQRRQGPSCPPRSCAELRTTDCGAAPAPYINKPHRPPTRPTTCSVPAVSAPLDLHRSQSPVASRLSITVEHVPLVHPHHPTQPSIVMPPKKSEGAAAPKAKSGAAHASYQVRCFVPSAACRHLCGYSTTLCVCEANARTAGHDYGCHC